MMKLLKGLLWPILVKLSLKGIYGVGIWENEICYLGTLGRQGLK